MLEFLALGGTQLVGGDAGVLLAHLLRGAGLLLRGNLVGLASAQQGRHLIGVQQAGNTQVFLLFLGSDLGARAPRGTVEEDEQEYLGIPGLLDADQVTTLLRARQADQVAAQKKSRAAQKMREENAGIPAHKLRAAKRKELQHLVSTWSRRSGETHATIHSRLRSRCGGPEVAQATTEQIEARIALLREWFVGRH